MTKKGTGNGPDTNRDNDLGRDGSDMDPMDDAGSDEASGDHDSGNGGIPPWMDAGEGDELRSAKEETKVRTPWADAKESDGDELRSAKEETKIAVVRLAENAAKGEAAVAQIRAMEPDLVKRAKSLAALNAMNFPDQKPLRSGDIIVMQPLPTDSNRWEAFEAIFGDGPGRPHVDTYRGRLVDHRGDIIDERYPMIELVTALGAAGLKGTSADICRKSFKEWALGEQHNDLVLRLQSKIPEWDGVERMESELIRLFGCFDTELNRDFSRYFWLALYCRVLHPGCNAPMVLSLFGAQNSGKSYFAKLLCRIITGDKDADSVQLDLSGDKMEFLREITGNSIVANVGEMTGFNRGDLNKIKDFITRTSDNMHYKYEGHFSQLRQWIIVMDGNKYEGLQRDDTGNRRLYPMFVGQLEDKHGQPAWQDKYEADFTGFEATVWQLLAEAAAWLETNGGLQAYEKYVKGVIVKVAEFSRNEMARDRGTIKDESLDVFLIPALRKCDVHEMNGHKNKGIWVHSGEISAKISAISRNRCDVKFNHLSPKMALLGAEKCPGFNTQGYLFRDVMTHADYLKRLLGDDADDVETSKHITLDNDIDSGF